MKLMKRCIESDCEEINKIHNCLEARSYKDLIKLLEKCRSHNSNSPFTLEDIYKYLRDYPDILHKAIDQA